MPLEIEKIVSKHESALKKYRGLYRLADLFAAFLVLYVLFTLTNMKDIFSMISTFEPYTGSKYDILGTEVLFETLALFIIIFILSLLITLFRQIRADKKDAIALIEEKYPDLKERLRTAYDNRDIDNIIVKDLLRGVLEDSKKVRSSAFLDRRKLAKNLVIMLFAASLLAVIVQTGYQSELSPADLTDVIENIPFISDKDSGLLTLEESEAGGNGDGGAGDIFGEPAVIIVEGTEVDLQIPPGAGQEGFAIGEEGEEREEPFGQSAAYDPEAIASQAYYENLPEGYRNIIQSYFEELAESKRSPA